MIGAAHLGERRMQKLFGEFGADVVEAAIEAMLDAAEARRARWSRPGRTASSMARPSSTTTAAATTTSGSPRKSPRRGSEIEVDLSESDPQVTSFVNSSHANMHAAVVMAFAYLIDPDTPKNSGALRPLKVIARQGTIVWADPGKPVTLCTSHPSNEIVEAIVKALASSCPDRVMAGWGRRFRIAVQGEHPRTGRGFIWHMFHARPGGGASANGDGWSSIGEWHSVGGLKFGSVEVAEARFPLHFRRHEFRPIPAATASFAAASGWRSTSSSKPRSRRSAIPRARGRGTAPAACSAARTARRIAIGCSPRAGSHANCAPRRSASRSGPAIALRSAPRAAAGGGRLRGARKERATAIVCRASSPMPQ